MPDQPVLEAVPVKTDLDAVIVTLLSYERQKELWPALLFSEQLTPRLNCVNQKLICRTKFIENETLVFIGFQDLCHAQQTKYQNDPRREN